MMRSAILIASVAMLTGCTSGTAELDVTGKVTLDGQPVGSGNEALIRFDPVDGKGKAGEGFLDKGEYSVRVPAGSYKVSVIWNRSTGKKAARPGMKGPGSEKDEVVAEIPAKFNTSTTLTAEVAADKRQHDFTLKK